MDIAMMNTMNRDYHPGMEICLNETAALPDPKSPFYPLGEESIGENEIRLSYEAVHAQHSALTAGLCSAWQTDLNACLNWWTAEYPNKLKFAQNPTKRFLSREKFAAEGPRMAHPEALNAYIDMMGVGRNEE